MHPMHAMKKAALALLLSGAAALAAAQEPTTLHMSVFPGAVNILLTIGQEQGMFAKHGLKLDIRNTPDSDTLRNGLADGTFDLVHAGADNAIAMVEAQGKDVAIVIGGDQGMLEFMARNDINSFADVRGKSLAVDAPNTSYALVAKKILKLNGLVEGKDYTVKLAGGTRERSQAMSSNPDMAVGMLNVPYSIIVKQQGLKSMGQARSFIGPYQAGSGFVLRTWAKAHPEVLERYLAAYIESQRWTMDPAHHDAVLAILTKTLKLEPAVAQEALAQLLTPGFGMAPDARLDVDGLRNVLALRAEIEGQWGGKPPAPDKYLELGYYERALKSIR
jgi:ABC-type nitrate/sulfonate/bicarbonate transport system substrate-binding protein